jgi:6-pyruvoyl-tetrahydropterin synthase
MKFSGLPNTIGQPRMSVNGGSHKPDAAVVATNGNGRAPAVAETPDDFWSIDEEALFHAGEDTYYQISTDVFFNARHFVSFGGRAGPEHTHSYRLQATCRTQGLDREEQVVVGYHYLRQKMTLVVNAYNNQLLNALPPFNHLQPTTEVLAGILFQQLDRLLVDRDLMLISVTVWESPTEAITYGRTGYGPG